MKLLLLMVTMLLALPLRAAEIEATALYYRMSESGIDPYLSRWLITDKFLRIDEGDAADNFILLDRSKRTVYSVVHRDRTVLTIPYRRVDMKAPSDLKQESRAVSAEKIPPVDGKLPRYRELLVNDVLCHSAVSIDELLPDAVQAIGEYLRVMAGEHAKNMVNIPLELQQPCALVQHIFNPLWSLEQGLPIQLWDSQGKSQALLDYKTGEAVEGALFVLPQGYHHYQTPGGY